MKLKKSSIYGMLFGIGTFFMLYGASCKPTFTWDQLALVGGMFTVIYSIISFTQSISSEMK